MFEMPSEDGKEGQHNARRLAAAESHSQTAPKDSGGDLVSAVSMVTADDRWVVWTETLVGRGWSENATLADLQQGSEKSDAQWMCCRRGARIVEANVGTWVEEEEEDMCKSRARDLTSHSWTT